jgi:hypothetical protein
MPTDYVHVCDCGRKYAVRRIKRATPDKDAIDCICGKEIVSWNGKDFFKVGEVVEGRTVSS